MFILFKNLIPLHNMFECLICGCQDNRLYSAKEMMFGLKDPFDYEECTWCKSIQIKKTPSDISIYYPTKYYSFNKPNESFLKRQLKRQRGLHVLNKPNLFGKKLVQKWGEPPVAKWIKDLNLNFTDSILDIGCGDGKHLFELLNYGFKNLTGIDPYIEKSITTHKFLKIFKKELGQADGKFDFIMINHALEHVLNQKEVMSHIRRLLKPDGTALVRIPITNTYAWHTYGVNWVQLDAPRHFFIHSKKSFKKLAETTGFRITKTVFDSTDFQFIGSLGYENGIPLIEQDKVHAFSKEEILDFKKKSDNLNQIKEGDQACFYLNKAKA